MAKRTNHDILAAWNEPGFAGFSNWLRDIQPRIRHQDNRYKPVVLEDWQAAILTDALNPVHNMLLYVQPRRHAKSTMHLLTILWLVTSRLNFTVACLGNHETHGQRVQMRPLRRVIRNTPALLALVGGEPNLTRHEIKFPATGGLIQSVTPTRQSAFGDQFNCLWVSDWHACPDLDVFNAYQASLLDSDERLTLIDANTGPTGDHVHKLEQVAPEDDGIYLHRVEYRDFEHYCEAAPKWISRTEAKRLKRITLPASFDRDILGKRGSAQNALFTQDAIEACKEPYALPVIDLADLAHGRKRVVGGGLDRAYGFSLHGDQTIWTVVAKVAGDDEEPHYWLLNQRSIGFSSGRGIKQAITKDHERYRLENICIESYNSQDIAAWCQDAKLPAEVIHATSTVQVPAFTELHRIVAEGRLHFPAELQALADEMRTFLYETTGKNPSFGHAPGFHDDRIYSLCWAIWALRDNELAVYEIPNIVCTSKGQHSRLCYMRAGDLILSCAPDCEAHRRVESMHVQHTRRRVDSELSLPDFFRAKVKVAGVRVHQNV